MKIKDLFENWNLTGLRINAPFMDMEWKPSDPDKEAAWDLYVELLTRITTQPLPDEDGVGQPHWIAYMPCSALHGKRSKIMAVPAFNLLKSPSWYSTKWCVLSPPNGTAKARTGLLLLPMSANNSARNCKSYKRN